MMLWKRTLSLLCCAALAITALLGCAPAPQAAHPAVSAAPASEETGAIAFTDMGGNEIALPAPAARIVALTPADVEILFAIGAGDTLIGCGEYCNYPAEALDIPVMQTGTELNMERLLAAAPEVLLVNPAMLATGTVMETGEQVESLRAAGITVVVTNALDIAGVYEAVGMLGVLTGRQAEAESVVAAMRKTFAGVSGVKAAAGKSVYFEISPLEYGLWTAGSGTFMDEIAGMLGLTNCFSDVETYAAISEEQVIERNPDYIVTITMYAGEGLTPEEEIRSRPGWETVAAVRSGAVLSLANDALSRPGPRLAEGAAQLFDLVTGAETLDDAA